MINPFLVAVPKAQFWHKKMCSNENNLYCINVSYFINLNHFVVTSFRWLLVVSITIFPIIGY